MSRHHRHRPGAEYFHIRPEPDLETICDPWVGEANETRSFCAYLLEGAGEIRTEKVRLITEKDEKDCFLGIIEPEG